MLKLISGKKIQLSILLFLYAGVFSLKAAIPISGIINSYTSVSAIVGTSLTVASTAGFAIGDKIMIIQMKGATITTTQTVNYGDVTAYNSCGNFEYTFITNIVGTTITIQSNLVNSYTVPTGEVQIVTVPQYCSVNIVDTLKAKAWDGSSGGILVFESGGTVTMNADIYVSGNGFRNIAPCNTGPLTCGNLNYYISTNNCVSGKKGEGIAEYVNTAQSGGRGHLANGGGGSNRGNNGGGGGGNYGVGGIGGFEANSCAANTTQGLGGMALDYTLGKMFLGGSGGNGQGNDLGAIFGGGAGGGIVIIAAKSIITNGYTIWNEGKDVTGITINEGAGGGGAGGVVSLDIPVITGILNISVNGGDGGSTNNNTAIADCTGPGGGGAGGVVWVSGGALNPNIIYSATGGLTGLALSPLRSCFNTSFGATAGASGNAIFNLPPHILPLSILPINLGPDQVACPLEQVLLDPGNGFSTYVWQDASTDSNLIAIGPGIYYVTVIDTAGCLGSDTMNITLAPQYNFNIATGDTTVCAGQTVVIDAGAGNTSYTWQDGTATQTYSTVDTGLFTVQVVDAFGCIGNATYNIHNFPPFTFTIGTGDTSVCYGQPVTIDAGSQWDLYLWQDLSTNQTFTTTQAGQYFVNVQDTLGCIGSATYSIFYFPGIILDLGLDTAMCEGDSIILDAGIYPDYLWNDGSQNSKITVTTPGDYSVTITDFNGCILADTITILDYYPIPIFDLNDTLICIPDTLTILAPAGFSDYLWNDGSSLNFLRISKPGGYSLTITNSFTCFSKDSFNVTLQCPTALYMPNAFTPNGDGVNDYFLPIGYNITEFHMQIFNRWWQLVYETDNFEKGWNGEAKGVPGEIGAYVYYVVWQGKLEGVFNSGTLKGNVTLIR
ncbi:MAG: gliding motility-associated C-terminal domain-containing protein [Chitinophagales bacterium]|nr:gliding motility-associated C-terminal domain-containing protein [Chitinophagales bacterium]